MKLKILSIALLVTVIVAIPLVQAFDWSASYNSLTSGYRVTTDRHGEEVPLATPVTAWAGTTNMNVDEVKFRWLRPNGSEYVVVAVTTFTMGTWVDSHGVTHAVREFNNTQTPDVVGDWGVQGIFYGDEGHGRGPIANQTEPTAIRARSFFSVPEVAIGTIAAVLAMFGALGLFAMKKKRVSIKRHL